MEKLFILYTYSITKLDKSSKVRFVYTLKGRREDNGIVEELGGKFLVPGCFMIPEKSDKEMIEVFSRWKVKPKRTKILLK